MGDIDTKDLLVAHQITLLEFIPAAHPNILRHVVRLIREKPGALSLLKTSALAVGIAFARRVTDEEIGEEIAKLMAELVENSAICEELKSQLAQATSRDSSVIRSRIYSIASEHARISTDSSSIHWLYKEILSSVLNESDLLAQLDALDTFVDVALSGKENAKALSDQGIVSAIYNLMEKSRESPDAGEFYTYGTRFLCYMARSYPQVIKSFPDFVRRLLVETRMFDQLGIVARLNVFDHFASLCYSLEAKSMMEEIFKGTQDLENTLGAAGAATTMGTMEMKCRTLQAITLIFENSTPTQAASWYEKLGGKALTHVSVSNVKKPFPDAKNAIYDFWHQLFAYPEIVNEFVNFKDFVEWALDDKSESEPEYEIRKRSLIRRIIDLSASSSDLIKIDADLVGKLHNYLKPATAPAPRVEEMAL
uniref:26S proteasome non-ATPase regulatory subunit 5 n=1 Tax=Caenorhabditis japonica TaxID=281687 RepID=A0A8R1DPJ4_CAEJA